MNQTSENRNVQFLSIEKNSIDVENTISFLKSIFSHPMSNEVWDWEFNTFPNETVLTIIKANNNTVGTQFMLPVPLNINGIETLSGKCENTYLNSEYKGTGVFDKLFNYAVECSVNKGMKALWAFTPAIKVYGEKFGFTVFEDIMYNFSSRIDKPTMGYFEKFSQNKLMNTVKYSYYYSIYKTACAKRDFNLFKQKAKYNKVIEQYKILDQVNDFLEIDEFYIQLRLQYKNLIHIEIKEPYFNWRIGKNINLSYIKKFFYKNGTLQGYYIVALNSNTEASITEFSHLNELTSNVMITNLLNEFSKLGVKNYNYFGNIENKINEANFNLFKNFGGKIQLNKSMPFVMKQIPDLNSDSANLNISKNWYLNGMWTEGFKY